MKINKTDRTRRTEVFLNKWKGNAREWDYLHGVLCLSHGWNTSEFLEFTKIIDTMMIAKRLDELNHG